MPKYGGHNEWPPLDNIEITRVDLILLDLRRQWKAAHPSVKNFAMARIDYWLDRRLELMK